jgi:hypothetical protein
MKVKASVVLSICGLLALAVMVFVPRIPQPAAYHDFADRRVILGIPNACDVLSNAGFAVVGILALIALRSPRLSLNAEEHRAYLVLFVGVLLTSVGSAYYHLAPDNARLVWDRLPMTLGFMGLLAAVLGERVSAAACRMSLVPLLVVGACSVVYWYVTEINGAGDLRPYLLVQFLPLFAIPLMIALLPPSYSHGYLFFVTLGMYVLAKICELGDAAIFRSTGAVSGHTLKHLLSAGGVYVLLVMIRRRHSWARSGRPSGCSAA